MKNNEKNEFYSVLKDKEKELKESVRVQPLDSYETRISAVNYAIVKSDEIEDIVDEMQEEMQECDGCVSESPVQMIYPMLLATYPDFCLFELGQKTFKAEYTYNTETRTATLEGISEVIVDILVKDAPVEKEEAE